VILSRRFACRDRETFTAMQTGDTALAERQLSRNHRENEHQPDQGGQEALRGGWESTAVLHSVTLGATVGPVKLEDKQVVQEGASPGFVRRLRGFCILREVRVPFAVCAA